MEPLRSLVALQHLGRPLEVAAEHEDPVAVGEAVVRRHAVGVVVLGHGLDAVGLEFEHGQVGVLAAREAGDLDERIGRRRLRVADGPVEPVLQAGDDADGYAFRSATSSLNVLK